MFIQEKTYFYPWILKLGSLWIKQWKKKSYLWLKSPKFTAWFESYPFCHVLNLKTWPNGVDRKCLTVAFDRLQILKLFRKKKKKKLTTPGKAHHNVLLLGNICLFYRALDSVYHQEILNIVWKTEIPGVNRFHIIIDQKTVCMNITI